ncbi:MAG TPA: oxygenase MpaB family protein [Candidatus Binatia bacterium]|jgi:uncharacterized protein (DUF2236 family)
MITVDQQQAERFFNPDSRIWQVDREMVLLLAGGRALLMQLAHPKIAAGVADHSRFQDDPFGRLYRTMSAMWSIVFDERTEARAALERVENRHRKVRGSVPSGEPLHSKNHYDAFDQELLLWVHATLIDSAMIAYDRFVRPLPPVEKIGYYDDSKKLACLFGIEEKIIPPSLTEFDRYMKRMLTQDVLAVGPTAKNLSHDILYARPWIFKPAGPLFRFVTAGLLPEKLREGYELKWNEHKEKIFSLLARVILVSLPLVPTPIRVVPNARAAERAFQR